MRRSLILTVIGVTLVGAAAFLLLRERGGDGGTPRGAGEVVVQDGGAGVGGAASRAGGMSPITAVPFSRPADDVDSDAVGPDYPGEADREHDLHGRVIDARDAPVPGARVEIRRNEFRELWTMDVQAGRDDRAVGATQTNRAGEFRIRVPQGRRFDVVVSKRGYPTTTVRDRYAGELVVVKLGAGATLAGHITRAADGLPVAGARMRAWRMADQAQAFAGETDAAGAFTFDGLEAGKVMVEVVPKVEKGPGWREVLLQAGVVTSLDFVLEDGSTITGQVTDAATREPIPDAEVGESWVFRRPVRTGPDGRYVLTGFGSTGNGDLNARAKGYGRTAKQVGRKPVPTAVVDFALVKARTVRGRTVAGDGSPVAGAYVAAGASSFVNGEQEIDWPSARSGADGTFVIDNLRRDLRHALCVRKEGFAIVVCDFPPRETDVDTVELGDITLTAPGSISGIVVDEKDKPVPDVRLGLTGTNADRFRLWQLADGAPAPKPVLDGYFGGQGGRTDDLGRFRFTDLSTGSYRIEYRQGGSSSRGQHVMVDVKAGAVTSGVRLQVSVGLPIKGRVVDPAGVPVSGAFVTAHRTDAAERTGSSPGSMITGPDGAFAIEGLDAGTYSLQTNVTPDDNAKKTGARLAPARTAGIVAGDVHVRVVLTRSVPITGTVLDVNGKPSPYALVTAYEMTGVTELGNGQADAEGAFSVDVKEGEPVRLRAIPAMLSGTTPPKAVGWMGTPVEVSGILPGSNTVVLTLPKNTEPKTTER